MTDQDELIQNSLLFLALRTKTLTSTQLDGIINHGGNINTKDANDRNNTPLHVAAYNGDPAIVRLLLDKGAKVSAKNSNGKTPLDVAQGSEVVKILQQYSQNVPKHESLPESDQAISQPSTTENRTILYTKRSGTSGIGGQLYETKLLTLILFRALNRKDIAEFYLGSNVDGLGALDDIVFKLRDSHGKIRMQFIQAKHRDNPDKDGKFTLGEILKEKGDFSIHKYFDSYLSIRRMFGSKSESDEIFKEDFEKVACDFVIYTSAKENFVGKKCIDTRRTEFSTNPDDILYSVEHGKTFKFDYNPQHVKMLATVAEKSRIQSIGSSLANFVLSGRTENIMSDNLMKTYRVVLVEKLFNICEIGQATFKTDFFNSKEKFDVILREAMYEKVLEFRKQNIRDLDLKIHMQDLLENPTAENISKLLGNVLRHDSLSNTLKVIKNRVKSGGLQDATLKNMIVSQETIRKATEIIGRSTLESLPVKFPPTFGNLDLQVRKSKQEQRIKHLVERFKDLFRLTAGHGNIVRIDESMIGHGQILNSGDVDLNGGFAGMVGNILILDPVTKLLKFNCAENVLQPNAKMLLEILKSDIGIALKLYRLDIKIDNFPQLTLENREEEEKFAKCFLDNLTFYTDQGKENEVETILKNEIKSRFSISDDTDCDAVFLKVHDRVQRLWKQQKEAPYLTIKCDYFDKAVSQVRDSPPLATISDICTSKINKYKVQFDSEAVQAFVSQIEEGVTNIVSNFIEQTCVKLLQHFGSNSYLFFTSQYLKNVLPHLKIFSQFKNDKSICKTLIIAGDQEADNDIEEILNEIKDSKMQLIVVTNEKLPSFVNHLEDEGCIFWDLTIDSQIKLTKEREIFFQGIKINFFHLLDSTLLDKIDAEMFSLLISKEELMLAGGVDSNQFEKIADFLIERKLLRRIIKIKKSVETSEQDVWVRSCEKFKGKCMDNDKINVHWVDSRMIWQKSRGSLYNVRENTESSYEQIVGDALELLSDRIVIVAAEPGMGKSTLITDLSERIKKFDPLAWVVRIDLLNYSKEYNSWMKNKRIDLPLAIKFLLNVQKMLLIDDDNLFTLSTNGKIQLKNLARKKISGKELFEIELFLNFYNKGHIVLLVDGFDEISPNYKEPVIKLLKIIQNNGVNKLWITTRNDNNHYELEDNLSIFSCTIKPFSKLDQKKFLKKFWKAKLKVKHLDNHRFSIFATNLIKLFSNSINNTESSFMGVPLQMRMIATIFLNDFKKYLYREHAFTSRIERQISAKLDLVLLYEEFFRIKFEEVLFGDKSPNIDKNDPKICELMEEKRQSIAKKHEKLALCALLDEQELNAIQVLPSETSTFIEDVKSGREKVGLICQIVKDKPRFVHQTFAEYFAARYLWDKFKASTLNSDEFIRQVFVPILTKSNRYQMCCFLQQIALKDLKGNLNLKKLGNKLDSLLTSLVPYVKNYGYMIENNMLHSRKPYENSISYQLSDQDAVNTNKCARTLLKIVENFTMCYGECKVNAIKKLDIEDCFELFSAAASEGYCNFIQKFAGLLKPEIFELNLTHNGWYFDPLLKAAARGNVNVVEILIKQFYQNVSTVVDKCGRTLIQHIFNEFIPYQFQLVHIFAQMGVIDGSTFLDPKNNIEKFPILQMLFEHAPEELVRLLACTTDFKHLNNYKISTNTNRLMVVIHGLSLCLLAYDDQLMKDFQSYGADLSQSINSLISQFCNRAVTDTKLFPDVLFLDKTYRDYTVWNTLFSKIKQCLMLGVGYNRKDTDYDLSTRQFVEQANFIHLLLKKLCEGTEFPLRYKTILKLIIIGMKRHNLLGPNTNLTILNYHVALDSSEFERPHRLVFGTYGSLMLCSFLETRQYVTRDKIITIFSNTVERYKKTLEQAEFPNEIYDDQDIGNGDKHDLTHWIYKIVELQTKQNYTFDDALLRVTQEMHRSCKRLKTMLEISGAKEAKDVKIFETEQILNILDLQDVETNEEVEEIMMKIIDCNGLSLIVLLLHHHSFEDKECNTSEKTKDNLADYFKVGPKRYVQDTVSFTEQAAKIYNLWVNLDQQYNQLLQTLQTNCQTVRNLLSQIDPDYRRAVINGQDPEYGSPLHYATAKGDLELVRTLLEFGADPNTRLDETGPLPRLRTENDELKNFTHFRPLHFAAMRGYGEIVEVLLENGAEVHFMTDSGWMALGLAKKYGHEKIVKQLGGKKPDANVTTG